jgi:formylglycine-generating enzyme required for sulfatase activity
MKTLPNVECRSSWGSQSSKILSSLIPEKRKCRSSIYPALQEYSESLCNIPAGTLDVGGRKNAFDKPSQTVTLSEYRLGATPVTVAIWKEYCASSGTTLPEAPAWGLLDDHPIVNVSWNDIMGTDGKGGFCAWASDVAGFRLTLPTEAQFEYAAQGGQRGLVYPWGNSFDEKKLWCSLLLKTRRTGTAPVIRTSHTYKNDFGLIDMSGNVWQWCSDLFYDASSLANFVGPASEFFVNHHAVHGGSWYYGTQKFFTCNHRNGIASRGKYYDIGFRLSAGPG